MLSWRETTHIRFKIFPKYKKQKRNYIRRSFWYIGRTLLRRKNTTKN